MLYLGIDTSNYTTSTALYDSHSGTVVQERKLLPVKAGELGLRQSDALFHHTVQLPQLLESLLRDQEGTIAAVAVSDRPRDAEGSYMPCFLAGVSAATGIAAALGVPLYSFSHQVGHIAAALLSGECLFLREAPFLALHVSGGTTEAVLVRPDEARFFSVEIVGGSSDLKAGQAIDRLGKMLGMPFPAGKQVDACSLESTANYRPKVKVTDGFCSLSGLQNQYEKMHRSGEADCDICKFTLQTIGTALQGIVSWAQAQYGNLPVVFSGGVMSNTILRQMLAGEHRYFATPALSADNACGTAFMASQKKG